MLAFLGDAWCDDSPGSDVVNIARVNLVDGNEFNEGWSRFGGWHGPDVSGFCDQKFGPANSTAENDPEARDAHSARRLPGRFVGALSGGSGRRAFDSRG